MSQATLSYWAESGERKQFAENTHKERISEALKQNNVTPEGPLQGQPLEPRFMYAVTISQRGMTGNWKAGQVSAMTHALLGQRLRDGTHDIATLAEIQAYLGLQAANLEATRATEAKIQNRQTVTVVTPQAPSAKG